MNSTLSSAESFSGVLSTSSAGAQTQSDASHPDCVAATCLTKDQMDLKETLLIYMKETAQLLDKKERLPSLKSIPMSILKMHTQAVNDILCYIEVHTIQEVILLLYCGAKLVGELCGVVAKPNLVYQAPPWKIRLQRKLKRLEHDLSQLCELQQGRLLSQAVHQRLSHIYSLRHTPILVICEQLRQQIKVINFHLKHYQAHKDKLYQNRLFKCNQHVLYQKLLNPNHDIPCSLPPKSETIQFWTNLWGSAKSFNQQASWVSDVQMQLNNVPRMSDWSIDTQLFTTAVKKVRNWKSPGLDCVQGFWLKHFTSLHSVLRSFFNDLLSSGGATLDPSLVKGRTVLLLKNPSKGNTPDNYRPITCLSVVWKLMTIIIYQIYFHLRSNKLFPLEQKGCLRQSRGTKDQLLIDKLILCDAKKIRKNLCMAWIDFKKAFDSVPHDWILKCLQLYGVDDRVQQLLFHSMYLWNTILTVDGNIYGEVSIQCGIFQGDSLSPLLFIMALMPLSIILNNSGIGYLLQRGNPRVSHLMYMVDIKLFASSRQHLDSLLTTLLLFSDDIYMYAIWLQ